MTRAALTIIAGALVVGLSHNRCGADQGSGPPLCPRYTAELRVAKQFLVRDDRAAALAALHRAQQALASCIKESSDETALAACSAAPASAHPA